MTSVSTPCAESFDEPEHVALDAAEQFADGAYRDTLRSGCRRDFAGKIISVFIRIGFHDGQRLLRTVLSQGCFAISHYIVSST